MRKITGEFKYIVIVYQVCTAKTVELKIRKEAASVPTAGLP
jgi:hypothetical protein